MSDQKVAIGIDLGTTKCCVGVVREGKVEILENERSRKTTPSYVAFTDTERLVGEDAKDQATLNPTNTVFGVKGIIGRGMEDSKVTEATTKMPYIIVDNAGVPFINVTYKNEEEALLPQQVTAMLLTKMKELAQYRLGCSVEDVVISVPSSFTNAQRQATKDAATIAGLNVLALINEPTAAAIAYQANRKEEATETIAVVDFGGGKLDVAIVSVNSARVSVKGLSGSTDLGGNNVDEILMAYIQEKFIERFSQEPPNGNSVLERLRSACVKLKNSLSLLPRVQDQLDCFGDDFLLPVSINSAKYKDMISNRIQSGLRTHLDRALEISGLNMQSISRVLLVGGSTRIPLVHDEIQGYFDENKLDRSVNPDEAIAQGAAIYAALLSGNNTVTELAVGDMLPNSFCFATQGCSDMQDIFCKNEIKPANKKLTVGENARRLKFELYEELSGRRNPHRLIGTLCLSDEFNKSVRLVSNVVFEIDQCGIFDVMIQLGPSIDSSYIFRDVVKNYAFRLNADNLQNYVAREVQFRQDEKEERDRVEAYTNLESCCFRLQGTMETTKRRQHLPDLVEQINAEAGEAIAWLDTEVNVTKSDCRAKLKSLEKLERNLKEEIYRLEKIEKERAAAKNALESFLVRVRTFLTNTDVSDEEEKADIVREQLRLVDEWFQLELDPSKADCDEKRVVLTNVVSTLEKALKVRREEKERKASVIDLQAFCRELPASVTNKPIGEADLQLVTELCDQAKGTLQWLESNGKFASKEECIKIRVSLDEMIETLQCRAELREQKRAAKLEKERERLVASVWHRCQGLCAKVQSSAIGIHDTALSTCISDEVAKVLACHKIVGKNMSKTECDMALERISHLEGLFSTWVIGYEEKLLNLEKERAEAAIRRKKEQAETDTKLKKEEAEAAIRRVKEQAETDTKLKKEQAEAAIRRVKEQAETDKEHAKEQAEADIRQVEKQAETKKLKKEQGEAAIRREKEQAETDKKLKKEQAEAAIRREKEQAETDKKHAKEQAEAAIRREKEQGETDKKLKREQTEAAIRREKEQAETDKKLRKEQAEAAIRQEKEQAETDKKLKKEQAEAAIRREKEKSSAANKLEQERTDALLSFENKWMSLESTLSMDVLKEIEPDLVNQARQCAEKTSQWLKSPGNFSPDEYKRRLETLKTLGQDLQSKDQQLKANIAAVDCGDSDIVMIDAESESVTEHKKSSCSLM